MTKTAKGLRVYVSGVSSGRVIYLCRWQKSRVNLLPWEGQ